MRPLPWLLAWTCNAHPSFGEPPVKYFGSLLLHKRLDICMTLEKHKIAKPQKILLWYCSWSWFNKNASQMYMQTTTQLESLLQICRTLFCKIVDIITSLPGSKSLTLTSASSQLPSWAGKRYISKYPVLDAVVKMSSGHILPTARKIANIGHTIYKMLVKKHNIQVHFCLMTFQVNTQITFDKIKKRLKSKTDSNTIFSIV